MATSRLVALPPFSGPSGSLRPIGIQKSGVSANGKSKAAPGAPRWPFLMTVSRKVGRRDPSIAVSATSPSPWAMCGSPVKNIAPGTWTGR